MKETYETFTVRKLVNDHLLHLCKHACVGSPAVSKARTFQSSLV